MRHNTFAVSLLLLLFAGCAAPEYVKPDSLAVPAMVEMVELQSDLPFKTDGDRGAVTLISGVYSSSLEDSEGFYFKGPPKCVRLAQPNAMGAMRYYMWDGGYWMPKSRDKKPRIFTYPSSVSVSSDSSHSPVTEKEGAARTDLLAMSNIPVGTPPVAAGLGAALGMGVLAVITTPSEADKQRVGFRFDPIPDRQALEGKVRSCQKPILATSGMGCGKQLEDTSGER